MTMNVFVVIHKISDSVVRRLKGELDDGREKSRQPPTSGFNKILSLRELLI